MGLLFPILAVCAALAAAAEDDRCRDRSCYPITGNLLIGRKHRLWASSTCGMRERERFCIVSHLEEQTKCFYCDSRQEWKPYREPYRLSHRIGNVVADSYETKNQAWWQSENGVQNVTVQLDLEAEFHFTHLIMTFKSFRPAAMIIERSSDFGKTWKPYRYFAYDCANTFPNIPEGTPSKHTDVLCTRAYSDVAPSTGGEIVYKVISPHIKTDDPYSEEISNLLKITNLRFNFTKLHTLGDDLLDYRKEITEKYYYAIYEIVVRGSCSCYGHASQCIPIDNNLPNSTSNRQDIVHGRCECTHNTEGLNCERCKPFFNDHPWAPAVGNNTHECRRCECNSHANTCHFDQAAFDESGGVSGGVCDDCQHNTQGKNCEQCKALFYRDPQRPIYDPYVCRPCDCDRSGSQYDGICESEQDDGRQLVAGRCYCKTNVDGHRCDRCKNGYWNLSSDNVDGCVACTCSLLGTYNNEGCDKFSGLCTCKRLVTGENCDQCLPEHYGLSEDLDGCKPCDCNIGGSYDNNCDILTGQCKCREHFGGRRCDKPDSSFYCADIDYYRYEAEHANITNGDILPRERTSDERSNTWTGEGFARVHERSEINFEVDNIQKGMDYNVVLRYETQHGDPIGWENVQVVVARPGDPDLDGPCANLDPASDFLIARFHPNGRYYEAHPPVCLEAGVKYSIRVQFGEKRTGAPDRSASVLIDSLVLAPPTDSLDIFKSPRGQQHRAEYEGYSCRHSALSLTPKKDMSPTCLNYICPIAAAVVEKGIECDCDPTGSISGICQAEGGQCECKPNVVGRRCDKCAVGTYGYGPSGCTECACDSVGSLSNLCDKQSGQCVCRDPGISGRQCNQCQPGFHGFPECAVCQCNGHANICDQQTGICIECRDLTTGDSCDRCQNGYYGDPRLGVGLPCKPCPCPNGPTSGSQHADSCYLVHATNDVQCNCSPGYIGPRCDKCATNYWGNPTELAGTCEKCDCNGNIDMNVVNSCNQQTGDCLLCLYNTEGPQCENCMEGFFGDAKIRSCQRCVCNVLGTNTSYGACDRVSGQCPCFEHVTGTQCDQCEPLHYGLDSKKGCLSCECDPTGVIEGPDGQPDLQCHLFDGQCKCKRGRGGRTCSECEDYFWGDPTSPDGCRMCECDRQGSASLQCHRTNGSCICQPGSGGPLCNECARGYTGQWPRCQPCGECFHQWDDIIQALKNKVETMITTANNIEDTGVASTFDQEFGNMEKALEDTRKKLADANIDQDSIDLLEKNIQLLKGEVENARKSLANVEDSVSKTTQKVEFAEKDVLELEQKADTLTQLADDLYEKANKIKEADVQGAYNMTKESAAKSLAAQRRTDAVAGILAETEKETNNVEELLRLNQDDFDKQFEENEGALADCENTIQALEGFLPRLNTDVCGGVSAPCDSICGGPGHCDKCGGSSCAAGAVSKAAQAKEFALEADQKLNDKQEEAENVLKIVRDLVLSTSAAQKEAEAALEVAQNAARAANASRVALENTLQEMNEFINANRSSPEQIRDLAQEVLGITIKLTPEEINSLASQIRESLAKIQNIDTILAETRGNKTVAGDLERKAKYAADAATAIKNTTDTVRNALEVATKAQDAARAAIDNADIQIQNARTDLTSAREETIEAEDMAKTANDSLSKIENDLKKLKILYLQILDDSRNAMHSMSDSEQASAQAEHGNKQLAKNIETANELLEKRNEGNKEAQNRAAALRQRASDLLYKMKKYEEEYKVLAKFDPKDSMAEYERLSADYEARAKKATDQIDRRSEFYANCDN